MRAVRCQELTGPKSLRVDDIPTPKPGPNEVLVEVHAAGVNFPDVLITYGKYQFKAEPPFIPGGEAAGVVLDVGSAVTHVKKGDRVAGTMVAGAYAEHILINENTVAKLPDGVSYEVGAATLLTYGTTYHALVDRGHLKKGDSLLVTGAAGGTGVSAIELGKLLGARVIAAASTDEKVAFCKQIGADEGINYTREDLKERTKALTKGSGVDVVYDPVGGPFAEAALRSIAWEGRFLVIGFAAGEIPKIPLNLALLKGCEIVGVFWGAWTARNPDKNRANAAQILSWVAEGKLKPQVDTVLKFTEATQALERLQARDVKGKLVLVP